MQSEVMVGEGYRANSVLAVVHDLKAPLCLMRQLALALGDETEESEREKLQGQIVDVSEQAMRRVNELLQVAQLRKTEWRMEPVSVRGVCEEVYREMQPMFGQKERGLEICFTNRLKLAVANRELLRSVIQNFCTNAVKYSDVETKSLLSVADYRGKIRVGVRDFGPQLPMAVWREMRTGGVQTPMMMAVRPESSGVGLYVASEFAKCMGAMVGATRHRDGVSFYVDLQVSQQASLF